MLFRRHDRWRTLHALVYTGMHTLARDVIDRYYAAFDAHRNEWQDLVADDVVFEGPSAARAGQGSIRRPDSAISGRPSCHTTVAAHRRWKHGHVAVRVRHRGAKRTTTDVPVAKWATVRDGLISEFRVFYDPREFVRASE